MSIRNLKNILIADAVTCTGVFAIGLLAAAPVGALLGLPANIVAVGGWICLAAALLMVVAALQKAPNPALVKLIALGNPGWVAASFAVLADLAAQITGPGIVDGEILRYTWRETVRLYVSVTVVSVNIQQ